MRLRRLVATGALAATKNSDGAYEFAIADLDAIGEAYSVNASMRAGGARAHASISGENSGGGRGAALAASTSSVPGSIPAWLEAAAAEGRDRADHAHKRDDREEEDTLAAASLLTTASTSTAIYPPGEPIGVDPRTRAIVYRPASVASLATIAPGTVSARMVELEQQLAYVQSERDRWRVAWRNERARALAAHEALSAVATGAPIEIAYVVATAVAHALHALDDGQLGDDHVAMTTARNAGMWAAQASGRRDLARWRQCR